jgi:hypothetical protein
MVPNPETPRGIPVPTRNAVAYVHGHIAGAEVDGLVARGLAGHERIEQAKRLGLPRT